MIHVRKTLSKKERKEFQEWQQKHLASIRPKTREEIKADNEAYWAKRVRDRQSQMSLRAPAQSIPSLPPQLELHDRKQNPQLSPELKLREQAAQKIIEERKFRVAPVYNKGGYQFYTDDMIDSMLSGRHRRR